MATFRCTVFFGYHGKGWSESYYTNASIIDDAKTAFRTLLTARMKLSPAEVLVDSIRISDTARPRYAIHDTPGAGFEHGTFLLSDATKHVNLITDAILIELIATPLHKNRIFMRGMPDAIFEQDRFVGDVDWAIAFGPAAGTFEALLISTWRCRNKATPPAVGYVYDPIGEVAILRATTRKPGRPFGQQAGRRRTPSAP